ncbi:hypothetical protein AAVH_15382 [Aphelenchoides avenae]|nr:hypothetical protein AAVH_15382 [Aphelenchus avenae]
MTDFRFSTSKSTPAAVAHERADNDKLKKELSGSKAKATRSANLRKKSVQERDDEIQTLEEEIEGLQDEIKKLRKPETILDAGLETARLRQAIGRFEGLADKVMMQYDNGGVALMSVPSRPTLPTVVLELQPSFFDKYDCRREYLVQIDYSLLLKGIASQAGKEQCRILKKYKESMAIGFKSADGGNYVRALTLATARNVGHAWTLVEDDLPYVCIFEMNSFVLAQATQKLSPVLLDFSNRGQPDAVVITDSEDRLGTDQREYLWCSLANDVPHQNDFNAEFSSTTRDTHLRIFVDPKYLRRCVIASSGAGSKAVEVAMSEDILRLRYGNEHFSLTYYIRTVKPAEDGERSYSPIEFGTEMFGI